LRVLRRKRRASPDLQGAEYDRDAGGPPQALRSYVICSTPRCGSGLLARGLASSGAVGTPIEYFNPDARAALAERWDCGAAIDRYVHALHSRRSTADGIFGVKLHWDQLAAVRVEMGAGAVDRFRYETSPAVLDLIAPQATFIRIVRQDLDRQAVSYWRALRSDVWSVPAGEAPSDTAAGRDPGDDLAAYSYEHIDACRRWVEQSELCWERLLRARGEQALVITYEQLVGAFEDTITRAVAFLAPGAEVHVPAPSTRALSDEVSERLVERFVSEREARQLAAEAGA
jgi:LPS sulfotransferase NodH